MLIESDDRKRFCWRQYCVSLLWCFFPLENLRMIFIDCRSFTLDKSVAIKREIVIVKDFIREKGK
jgi:hypothetical protein